MKLKSIKILLIIFVIINFVRCNSVQDQSPVGTYYNIKKDIDLSINETLSWGDMEYELTELKVGKRGRFDRFRHSKYKMTVFEDMSPDYFAYYLIFSEDYNFIFSGETGELLYVKKYIYNALPAKVKETLKLKKLQL